MDDLLLLFFFFSLQTADLHEILAINYYHLRNLFQKKKQKKNYYYYITKNVTFSVVNCHVLAQKLWVEMGQKVMINFQGPCHFNDV